ncbi:MAG: UDP-N-acetylmuramyl-tripeptide synthetase [Candidatus Paceibacterota bacterium]
MQLDDILFSIKKLIPKSVFHFFQPAYHFSLAFLGYLVYRNPSKHLTVIAVTGTKGKTTTTELLNAILEENGHPTVLTNTVRIKVAERSERNLFKTSVRGRFFLQRTMRQAVNTGCTYAVIELTSEGAKQFRHRFIELDALIFTNLHPEHIESHGSFEQYREAKLDIARGLARSPKTPKYIVANADDPEHSKFVTAAGSSCSPVLFSLADAQPYSTSENGLEFIFEETSMVSPLLGAFNLSNILAALTCLRTFGIPVETAKRAIETYTGTPGRVEEITEGQDFRVFIDYAHTPDSLKQLYETFPKTKKVCVLGNAGGGRDTWKRKSMGTIADTHCDEIILTNEDPYDEDPRSIVEEMKTSITKKPCAIIMDRREAIHTALQKASSLTKATEGEQNKNIVVLITGKGTDPYIMEANNTKTPWSDAEVAREELAKLRGR